MNIIIALIVSVYALYCCKRCLEYYQRLKVKCQPSIVDSFRKAETANILILVLAGMGLTFTVKTSFSFGFFYFSV
jgi:hypothetical protein